MSTQDYDHPACFELFTGIKGMGKTTLWFKAIRREQAWMKFVYDHQAEFAHRFKIPSVNNPDALLEKTSVGGYIAFDPRAMFGEDIVSKQEGFKWFCSYVFTVAKTVGGRKLFACDELQKLVDNRTLPKEFLTLADEGRRHKVDIYAVCHGPNLLHNSIRNEVTKIYSFRQMDETAIDYLLKLGFDGEKLKTLPKGRYLLRVDTGEITEGGKAL